MGVKASEDYICIYNIWIYNIWIYNMHIYNMHIYNIIYNNYQQTTPLKYTPEHEEDSETQQML